VKVAVMGLLSMITLTCREIEPPFDSNSIKGFQLDGIVANSSGIRLYGVDVSLFYQSDSVANVPVDTHKVIVNDVKQVVDISVYTLKYEFVSTIFFGYMNKTGPVTKVYWDGKDWNKQPVAGGMYLIRFFVDTAIVKYSPIILSGQLAAKSDRDGLFSIANNILPIGKFFDYYDLSGTFRSQRLLLPKITLQFSGYGRKSTYSNIELLKDKITSGSFIL